MTPKPAVSPSCRSGILANGLVLAAVILALAVSCSSASREENYIREVLKSPQKQLENYSFDPESPLISRVKTAPLFVIKHLRRSDRMEGYQTYRPLPREMTVISNALENLPPLAKKVLRDRLVGLYFIENLTGSGFTDWILDKNGRVYCLIGINPLTLGMTVSEWLTWKEKTAFRDDGSGVTLSIDCGQKYSGFLGILLHEAAHAVDYIRTVTPYVDYSTYALRVSRKETLSMTEFVKGIWETSMKPLPEHDFPERSRITFYLSSEKTPHSLSRAPELYRRLEGSPFVSLYGTISWSEDLAEFLMYYHLSEALGQGYSITVSPPDEPAKAYRPLSKPSVRKRIRSLRSFYY